MVADSGNWKKIVIITIFEFGYLLEQCEIFRSFHHNIFGTIAQLVDATNHVSLMGIPPELLGAFSASHRLTLSVHSCVGNFLLFSVGWKMIGTVLSDISPHQFVAIQ